MCASLSDSPYVRHCQGSYPARGVLDNRNLNLCNRQRRIVAELMPKDRVLVTGASGRVARLLRLAWRDLEGPRIVWLSRHAPADVIWETGAPLPEVPQCDTLIALWGRVAGTLDELTTNIGLVHQSEALAEACGARRVLHFSSAAIYGPGTNLREGDPPHPANAYGHSKLAMEAAVRALPASSRRHCCLRLANVVGADSLAPALAAQDTPVRLDRFADGAGPLRSYIAPGDLADVLLSLSRLAPDDLPDVLNVTAPEPVSMESLVRAAGRPLIWQDAPETAVQSVTLDGTRLARLFRFMYLRRTAERMIEDWHTLETAQ